MQRAWSIVETNKFESAVWHVLAFTMYNICVCIFQVKLFGVPWMIAWEKRHSLRRQYLPHMQGRRDPEDGLEDGRFEGDNNDNDQGEGLRTRSKHVYTVINSGLGGKRYIMLHLVKLSTITKVSICGFVCLFMFRP
jgi:hypothetical protein